MSIIEEHHNTKCREVLSIEDWDFFDPWDCPLCHEYLNGWRDVLLKRSRQL